MFRTETLIQGGPERRVMQELWQKSSIPGSDLSMPGKFCLGEIFRGNDYKKTFFALIDENFEISLPLLQGVGGRDLLGKIAGNNSAKNSDSDPDSLLTNLGLKLGKNKKFLGPEVLCAVDKAIDLNGNNTLRIKVKNFVLDNINLAEQLQWFGIYLTPSSRDKLE